MPSSTYYSKYRKKIKDRSTSNETSKINDFDQINETTFISETIQKDKELNNQNEHVEAFHLEGHHHLEEDHHHYNKAEENSNDNQLNDSFNDQMNEIFSDENPSKEDLAATYLTSFYNGRVSQKSLKDFLMCGYFGRPKQLHLPFTSYDGLTSMLNMNEKNIQYEKSWFCSVCQTVIHEIDDRLQRHCNKCKTTRLTMHYHLNLKSQIQNIMNKLELKDLDRVKTSNDLTDFTDGRIYRNILESEDVHLFNKKQAFTFTLNTDGISVSNKSKLTIWPVFLVINELPLNIRFSIDNVILAGLSVGSEKPNIDVFFNPIVIKLITLEIGIDITIENVTRDTNIFKTRLKNMHLMI
jgi:hypothetical protein